MSKMENSEDLSTVDHLFQTAHSLRRAGALDAALPLLESALKTCKEMSVSDGERLARLLNEFGTIAFWRGHHLEAEKYYKQALETLELATYPQHPILAPVLDHLAHLYIAMDRFDQADEMAQRALSIRQASMLPNDSATVENLRMCAIIAIECGKLPEAEHLLEKAILILEPSTIGPFEEFIYLQASVFQLLGKNDEAEAAYKRALITFANRQGRPARYAACMTDYAKFLRQIGRVKDAEKLEQCIPKLNEAYAMEEAIGTKELDRDLPDTDVYQCLVYPVTIFH
jgi:tetratricopeptide (TPR) repeat protein